MTTHRVKIDAAAILGGGSARQPNLDSKDGYKGNAKLGSSDALKLKSFKHHWDDPQTPEEKRQDAKDLEEYETQVRHRQLDRFARVKIASAKAKNHGLMALGLYFAFFTYLYSRSCSKFVDCPEDEKIKGFDPPEDCTTLWTLVDSFYFVIVSLTTVGYGDFNFADESGMVRIIFFLQSLGGFILITAILTNMSVAAKEAETAKDFVVRTDDEEDHPDEDLANTLAAIKSDGFKLLVLCGLLAVFLMHYEGYDASTALYFVYVSVSTVGFGDLCVETDLAKIVVCFFLLFGCAIFANVIGSIAEYRASEFEFKLMQKLLAFKHDGARISLFDEDRDGGITSGEFLIGYLVSLGKVRKKTCLEIMAKFKDLSLGKRYIDIEMFTARQEAVKAAGEAGKKAAADATAAGLSPAAIAAKAGDAGESAARGCVAEFKVPELGASEQKAVGTLSPELAKSYEDLKSSCSIPELNAMERALDKLMTKVRMAKNFEVKVALAAGTRYLLFSCVLSCLVV
jgi:hypothetical protein